MNVHVDAELGVSVKFLVAEAALALAVIIPQPEENNVHYQICSG